MTDAPYERMRQRAEDTRDRQKVTLPQRSAPAAGDLYALEGVSVADLEWLVLEVDRPGHLRLLPADTEAWVTSSDVAVEQTVNTGPLVVRGGYPLSVPARLLDSGLLSGRLDPRDLDRVRTKLRQLAEGTMVASSENLEAEGDAEYLLWRQHVLAPAVRELQERAPAEARAEAVSPLRFPVAQSSRRAWMLLAAAVVLLVSLALVGTLFWLRAELREARSQLAEQGRTRQQLEAQHRAEVDSLHAQRAAASAEQQEQLAQLRQRLSESDSPQTLISLPVAWLLPSLQRGESTRVVVPSDLETATFVLQLSGVDDYPSYRLQLLDPHTLEVAWSRAVRLPDPSGPAELVVSVPRQQVSAGDFQFRLQGLRGASVANLATYSVELVDPPTPPQRP